MRHWESDLLTLAGVEVVLWKDMPEDRQRVSHREPLGDWDRQGRK